MSRPPASETASPEPLAHIERKHRLYAQIGLLGRALGQQTRLEIIEILAQCPRTVEMLSAILQTDIKSVSAHLKVLRKAGLVCVEHCGNFRRYSVANARVLELAVLMSRTARETAEAAEETGVSDDAALDVETALQYAGNGELMLIDVRPAEEFEAAHLPHARSFPLETLEAHLETIPRTTACAAYCRGSCCFLAQKAAEIFKRHGRRLLIVREGVLDWLGEGRAGLLVEDGAKSPS